ncbi:unnamed protein product [Pleuronectes platessa]|uniref:Uncharacterized protein n=1 Tax=Pleuronectes platessa TaxID=8262 RepID=A0A9N7UGY8_PLEPL|nr:unnamed protein product [Pleuronectes platessa]
MLSDRVGHLFTGGTRFDIQDVSNDKPSSPCPPGCIKASGDQSVQRQDSAEQRAETMMDSNRRGRRPPADFGFRVSFSGCDSNSGSQTARHHPVSDRTSHTVLIKHEEEDTCRHTPKDSLDTDAAILH